MVAGLVVAVVAVVVVGPRSAPVSLETRDRERTISVTSAPVERQVAPVASPVPRPSLLVASVPSSRWQPGVERARPASGVAFGERTNGPVAGPGLASSAVSTATSGGIEATVAGPSSSARPSARSSTSAPARSTTAVATTASTAQPPPASTTTIGGSAGRPDGEGRVIWEDHFDRLDLSHWRLEHSTYGDGNNEVQCYRPENMSVVSGRLVLRAVAETYTCPNGSTRQITSGMVRSRGVTFSPGQAIEFRVKLTPADPEDQGGLWPAVWASGWGGGGWPRGGELDFLEVMTAEDPRRAVFSIHYADPGGVHRLQNRGVTVGGTSRFSDAWHTVRFDYGHDGRLTWYLDGRTAFTVDAASTLQGYPAPFDQPIDEIKINLAVGGRPGPLAAGAVGSQGATFEVDYIRIVAL